MFHRWQCRAGIALVAAAWAGLLWIAWLAYLPPPPRGAEIPDDEFSATRARVILRELVADGIPHPAGSPQNAVVRERIMNFFRGFGYEPQLQSTTRTKAGRTIPLNNVLARRQGSQPGRAVMLVAHYDSVPAGPGASDDGSGVAAILEIARMLRDQPRSRNDVNFLITDGEELGMFGAEAFVREHPWAKDAAAAINLEARGTSGPSLMFETGADNAWLMALYARHVRRPATSSLYYEVYKTLPNDTDFTIFKRHGIEGCNFAFIRNVRDYHTAGDNFVNSDPASLQHHGDHAWQMLGALATCDLDHRTQGRAIYTDILGRCVLWWPASINLLLAAAVLATTGAAGIVARARGLWPTIHWQSLALSPVAFAAALAVGTICDLAFRFAGLAGKRWSESPLPIALVYCGVAIVAIVMVIRRARWGTSDAWSVWSGTWLWWNASGLVAAWFVPGGSYLFTLPGTVAALAGLLAALLPKCVRAWGLLAACCVGAAAAGVFWFPVALLLYDALGFSVGIVYPACAGILMLTIAPLTPRGRIN